VGKRQNPHQEVSRLHGLINSWHESWRRGRLRGRLCCWKRKAAKSRLQLSRYMVTAASKQTFRKATELLHTKATLLLKLLIKTIEW